MLQQQCTKEAGNRNCVPYPKDKNKRKVSGTAHQTRLKATENKIAPPKKQQKRNQVPISGKKPPPPIKNNLIHQAAMKVVDNQHPRT